MKDDIFSKISPNEALTILRQITKTDGYTSPEDMSFEMFEEAIVPFIKEMHRLSDLKMHQAPYVRLKPLTQKISPQKKR